MNAPKGNRYGHSADVQMHLTVNGHVLEMHQLAPDFIILRNPIEHGPDKAEIFLSIDGNEHRWNVQLVNGIQIDQVKTAIASCSE
jgi:hypothetical protein